MWPEFQEICMCGLLPLILQLQLVLPFWYRLTWVVPEKGPLNVCVWGGAIDIEWHTELLKSWLHRLSQCLQAASWCSVPFWRKLIYTVVTCNCHLHLCGSSGPNLCIGAIALSADSNCCATATTDRNPDHVNHSNLNRSVNVHYVSTKLGFCSQK